MNLTTEKNLYLIIINENIQNKLLKSQKAYERFIKEYSHKVYLR